MSDWKTMLEYRIMNGKVSCELLVMYSEIIRKILRGVEAKSNKQYISPEW